MFESNERLRPSVLSILRIVIGVMFLAHGLVKLFGFPEGALPGQMPLASLAGVAAVMEVIGGFLITIGLLTRPVAFLLSGEMAFAYFLGHAPQGFYPLLNGGEPAILYCFVFLYLAVAGGGRWSVDARGRV
jgi:putative oxidoreductase